MRHRHLQYGISSPVAVLAAASQRTSRIELGTAVIPLGWENPLRLAEDLATVDLLSGGRLNPGVSVGPPMHYDKVKAALYPDTADVEDFSYERVQRLLRFVRGEPATDFSGVEGIEVFSDRVQPHSPGLAGRMWYGGASLRSAQWAGEHGMNLLASSVVKAEESEDFAEIQLSHIRTFRAPPPGRRPGPGLAGAGRHPDRHRDGRAAGEVPAATPTARTPRTATPQGPARMMFEAGPGRHVRRDRRAAVRARRVPGGRRGRVRPAVQLRARRLRPDPHRHRDQARPGARLAAGELILRQTRTST